MSSQRKWQLTGTPFTVLETREGNGIFTLEILFPPDGEKRQFGCRFFPQALAEWKGDHNNLVIACTTVLPCDDSTVAGSKDTLYPKLMIVCT